MTRRKRFLGLYLKKYKKRSKKLDRNWTKSVKEINRIGYRES